MMELLWKVLYKNLYHVYIEAPQNILVTYQSQKWPMTSSLSLPLLEEK